jgi:hypothetical protein
MITLWDFTTTIIIVESMGGNFYIGELVETG